MDEKSIQSPTWGVVDKGHDLPVHDLQEVGMTQILADHGIETTLNNY